MANLRSETAHAQLSGEAPPAARRELELLAVVRVGKVLDREAHARGDRGRGAN